jgi:hypothetical protein
MHWDGELPLPGHCVKADKGRTAYIVIEVRRPRKPDTKYVAKFICERYAASRLPDGAVIHPWCWAQR